LQPPAWRVALKPGNANRLLELTNHPAMSPQIYRRNTAPNALAAENASVSTSDELCGRQSLFSGESTRCG
jgi:hypothetical protein